MFLADLGPPRPPDPGSNVRVWAPIFNISLLSGFSTSGEVNHTDFPVASEKHCKRQKLQACIFLGLRICLVFDFFVCAFFDFFVFFAGPPAYGKSGPGRKSFSPSPIALQTLHANPPPIEKSVTA